MTSQFRATQEALNNLTALMAGRAAQDDAEQPEPADALLSDPHRADAHPAATIEGHPLSNPALLSQSARPGTGSADALLFDPHRADAHPAATIEGHPLSALALLSRSSDFDRPSRTLLFGIKLKDHDPLLYSDHGKRFTTTVPALYAWGKLTSPAAFAALENQVLRPGAESARVISEFLATIKAWLEPATCTLCGLLIEGLTQSPESSVAAQTEDLPCVAVDAAQNQTAAEITAKVKHTGIRSGKYDRTPAVLRPGSESAAACLRSPWEAVALLRTRRPWRPTWSASPGRRSRRSG